MSRVPSRLDRLKNRAVGPQLFYLKNPLTDPFSHATVKLLIDVGRTVWAGIGYQEEEVLGVYPVLDKRSARWVF